MSTGRYRIVRPISNGYGPALSDKAVNLSVCTGLFAITRIAAISGEVATTFCLLGAQVALDTADHANVDENRTEIEVATMARRKIFITETDRERLEALLDSEFARAIGPSDHLDDLRAELDRAEIVRPEDVPHNVVTMNSTVSLRDCVTKEKETYTLVFPNSADIANNRLSVLAPIGTAILGQRLSDVLRWRVPQGWRRLKVEHILYQPEREGLFHV